jgi:hypothetical protein
LRPSLTPSINSSLSDAALRYAEHGIATFPLTVVIRDGEKECQPITKWSEQSTIDPEKLRWWYSWTAVEW